MLNPPFVHALGNVVLPGGKKGGGKKGGKGGGQWLVAAGLGDGRLLLYSSKAQGKNKQEADQSWWLPEVTNHVPRSGTVSSPVDIPSRTDALGCGAAA